MSSLIGQIITLYEMVLIVRIVLTWIPHNPDHPAAVFLHKITDPVLEPVRRVIPPIRGIDISPIIVFVALGFVRQIFS